MMGSTLTSILAFLVAISILVAVHEYGHYIIGRLTGMKVLRFSIGFGKPIWTRMGKAPDRTEYCVSSIPLGGYVRFLDSREGPVDPVDEGRAFNHRPIPARIAVLLAGPAFNFLLAILLYWGLMAGGTTDWRPAVGKVTDDSYAAQAGLEYGDRIVSIGDVDVENWDQALPALLSEMVDDGRIELSIIDSYDTRRTRVIDVGDDKTRLTEPGLLFDGLGFQVWRPPAVIGEVNEDSAASDAGIEVGDRITSIAGQDIVTYNDIFDAVVPRAGETVTVVYERFGRSYVEEVTLRSTERDGQTVGLLGVLSAPVDEAYYYHREYSPLESLRAALDRTWRSSVFTVEMIGRMLTGDVSAKNISGPINIAQIAGTTAERGLEYFVGFLAIVSISLGILNLLPVPVLDGGQIVYQLAEAVKGSPLTERTQIIGQQVGIVALLLLMSFAFYNDIARILG